MTVPAVKICGLMRHEDARAAVESGASYLGVVLAVGGRRTVMPEQAAAVLGDLPVRRVGVFVDSAPEEVSRMATMLRLDVVQLHGDESADEARTVGAAGPWQVWKAVRVRAAEDFLAAAREYGHVVNGLLLDGWHPDAAGGTGTCFPWEQVARHRAKLDPAVSLIAAGGLRPDNVARAVEVLRPAVVDVSSGVERHPGAKDLDAMRAFVAAATEGKSS